MLKKTNCTIWKNCWRGFHSIIYIARSKCGGTFKSGNQSLWYHLCAVLFSIIPSEVKTLIRHFRTEKETGTEMPFRNCCGIVTEGVPVCYIRALTKLRRRRQRPLQKPIGLVSKTTLHVHHAVLYISLPSRCTTTTWNNQILSFFEEGNGRR